MRDRFREQVKNCAGGALATKEFDSGALEGLYVKDVNKVAAMREYREQSK